MKKVILINNLYYPFNKGGAEKIVEITYQELKKQGYSVKIISTKPYNKKTPDQNRDVYYLNSFYYHLNKIPLPARFIWHLADIFSWKKYRRIKKILQQEKADLVITHNLKGVGHLTPWAVKKAGSDHFHTLHDIQLLHPGGLMMINKEKIINSLTANLYQKINVFFFNKIDKVISPSNWLLSLHVQKNFFPNSEKKVVFNPITSSFSNKNTSRPENKEFTFLYAGQIEEHKGVLLLIDAFKKLEAEHPRTKLKIVGDGSIIKKARRRAGGTNTIFTGRKEKVEIIEEMRAGDCLVVPSLCYENSPTVIYEATSAGLSILASDHGGIPELVSYFGGEIFEAGKPEKLAEKMENIYKNPQSPKRIPEEKLKKLTSSEYIKKIFYSNHQ